MNARRSTNRTFTATILGTALLAVMSFSAAAQSTSTLDGSTPVPATLMPTLSVSATTTDPIAKQSWRLSSAKPVAVTLMPVLTVGIDADALAVTTLPTTKALASIEQAQPANVVFGSIGVPPGRNPILLGE